MSSTSVDRGASAMIFKGTLKFPDATPTTVALKVFPILLREHEREMLRRELRTTSKVSHNCILPFIGTAELGGRTIIVSPFMKNGNLLAYLRGNPGVDRRLLIKQVAEAVNFLHVHARVVHGDLKCENVLVSNGGNALVTDFGLSTLIDKEESSATTRSAIRSCNTFRFAAPELLLGPEDTESPSSSLRGPRSKTRESDVYAFAMLLLQAFTGKVPWPELHNEAVLLRVVSGTQHARPGGDALQLGLSDQWWAVCLDCWRFDPHDRPSMLQVWNRLEEFGGSEGLFYDTNTASLTDLPAPHDPTNPQSSHITGCYDRPWSPYILTPPLPPSEFPAHISYQDTEVYPPSPPMRSPRPGSPLPLEPSEYFDITSPQDLYPGIYGPQSPYIPIPPLAPSEYHSTSPQSLYIPGHYDRPPSPYIPHPALSPYQYPIMSCPNSPGYTIDKCEGAVVCVVYDSRNSRIIFATNNNSVRAIDASTGLSLGTPYLCHSGRIHALCLHPTSRRFFSCSDDHSVIVWTIVSSPTYNSLISGRQMTDHSDAVTCMAHSPAGDTLVSGSLDCTIRVWDSETMDAMGSPLRGDASVLCVAFSPDSSTVALGSVDGIIRLWHVSTRTRMAKVGSPMTGPIRCLSFAPGGRIISVSWPAQSVYVWRVSSGELVCQWQPEIGLPSSIAIAPSGELLAYHSPGDGEFYMCDAQSGEPLRRYTCPVNIPQPNPAMSFSSNNESLVVGYYGGFHAAFEGYIIPVMCQGHRRYRSPARGPRAGGRRTSADKAVDRPDQT